MTGDFRHEALIYASEDQMLARVVPFLREGLAADEVVLLGVAEEQRSLILDALGDEAGAVAILDTDQYGRPYEAIRRNRELYERCVADGASRVRVVGTVPDEPATWHGWSRYETGMNSIVGHLPVWAICLYDERDASAAVLGDVRRTHTHVADSDGTARANPDLMDSETFLRNRTDRDVSLLEHLPPGVDLTDPRPDEAREAVHALAEAAGVTDLELLPELELAVAEIVTNANDHGKPPITVRAWATRHQVAVAVRDHGPGPASLCAGFAPRQIGDRMTLGLHLVHEICDEVTLERLPDGFIVHLVANTR